MNCMESSVLSFLSEVRSKIVIGDISDVGAAFIFITVGVQIRRLHLLLSPVFSGVDEIARDVSLIIERSCSIFSIFNFFEKTVAIQVSTLCL